MITNSNSRFALTQIFLDRTRMDEVTTTYMVKAGGYRYGFNGMEKDDEVKGAGNSYTTEFRQYDPRLGRWLSIDPLFQNFPWQSPYVAFDNNPIILVDPKGLAAENGDDAKSNQSGFPENAKEGQEFIDINGRKWEFMKSEDGKSSDWVRASGDLPEAIVLPEKVKAEYKKNYERLQRNRTSIMGQFIGDGTAWQGVIPDGRSIYYDPLINDPNNPNATNWQKARANHKALEGAVAVYSGASLALPFVAGTVIITAPAWVPYLAMGTNYTMQMARAYHTTFGMKGGYLNIGANYLTQSFSNGSMNPLNHNMIEYVGSAFAPNSISGQMAVGAVGGLINITPNEGKVKHLFNQNAGITLGNVTNGATAPIYNLGGSVSGFIFGNLQQAIMGKAMNNLEKQLGNID